MFYWRLALSEDCPPNDRRISVLKWSYTLPELMQLFEMVEIKSALETARHLDAQIEKPSKGVKR